MATKTYENIADKLLMKTGLDQPTPGSVAFAKIGQAFEQGLTPVSQQFQKQGQIDRKEFGMSPGKADIMKMYGGPASTLAAQWEDANNKLVNFKPGSQNLSSIVNTEKEITRLKTMIKEYKKGNRRTIPFNAMTKILDHVGDIANKRLRFFEEESFKIKGTAGHSAMKGKQKKLEEFLGQIEEFKTTMSGNISDIKQKATAGYDTTVPVSKTSPGKSIDSPVQKKLNEGIDIIKNKVMKQAEDLYDFSKDRDWQSQLKNNEDYYVITLLDKTRDAGNVKGKSNRVETKKKRKKKWDDEWENKRKEEINKNYIQMLKSMDQTKRTITVDGAEAYIDDKNGTVFYRPGSTGGWKKTLPQVAGKDIVTTTEQSKFKPEEVEKKFADIERLYNENKVELKSLEAEAPANKNTLRIEKRAIEEKIRQTIPGYSEMLGAVNTKKATTGKGGDDSRYEFLFKEYGDYVEKAKANDAIVQISKSGIPGASSFVSKFGSYLNDNKHALTEPAFEAGLAPAIENVTRTVSDMATQPEMQAKFISDELGKINNLWKEISVIKPGTDGSYSPEDKAKALLLMVTVGSMQDGGYLQKALGLHFQKEVDKRSGGLSNEPRMYKLGEHAVKRANDDLMEMGKHLGTYIGSITLPQKQIYLINPKGESMDLGDPLGPWGTDSKGAFKTVYNKIADDIESRGIQDVNEGFLWRGNAQKDRLDAYSDITGTGELAKQLPLSEKELKANPDKYKYIMLLYKELTGKEFKPRK